MRKRRLLLLLTPVAFGVIGLLAWWFTRDAARKRALVAEEQAISEIEKLGGRVDVVPATDEHPKVVQVWGSFKMTDEACSTSERFTQGRCP